MKPMLASLGLFASALLWNGCSTAPVTTVPPADVRSPVQVNFDHPEKFTDVRTRATSEFDPSVLEQLRAFLVQDATPHIPPGGILAITFTDIDLAGDIEPWRITAHDVRIIKEIYPPRANFTWVLRDSTGKVLRQGEEHLIDLNFMSHPSLGRGALFYDKEMLRDWVALRRWR